MLKQMLQDIYDQKSEDNDKIKPPQPIPEATLPEDFGDLENIKMNPLLQDEFFDLLKKIKMNQFYYIFFILIKLNYLFHLFKSC